MDDRIIDHDEPRPMLARLFAFLKNRRGALLGIMLAVAIYLDNSGDPNDAWRADLIRAIAEQLGAQESRLMVVEQGGAGVDPAYLADLTAFTDDVDRIVDLTADNARLEAQLGAEQALRSNMDVSRETEVRRLTAAVTACRSDYAAVTATLASYETERNDATFVRIPRTDYDALVEFSARVEQLRGP